MAKEAAEAKTGRLNRDSYLLNMVIAVPVVVTAGSIANTESQMGALSSAGFFAALLVFVFLPFIFYWTAKRLHDLGKSGWFTLLYFVPVVALGLLIHALFPGEKRKNQWGKPQKGLAVLGIKANSVLKAIGILLLLGFICYVLMMLWLFSS